MQIFLRPISLPEKVFVVQPSHFCKNLVLQVRNPKDSLVRGPIGNRFVDLSETGFLDLSETGSWTYLKPVCGPIGNRFVDLTETGSCLAPKGSVSFSELTKSN